MQNERSAGRGKVKMKGSMNASSLAVSLLCLFWVCLVAVLPGVLVGMNDRQLYDTFIPAGAARVTAGFTDNALQRLETLRQYKAGAPLAGAEDDGVPVRDGARVAEICEFLLSHLALLQNAGLLTASETEILPLLLTPASPGLAVHVFGEESIDRFIRVRLADDSGMLCEVEYDAQDDKILTVSLALPKDALGILPQPVDAPDGLRAYIAWLGVAELTDFAISTQADGAAVAYSPTADLLLAYQSATAPDGVYSVRYSIA